MTVRRRSLIRALAYALCVIPPLVTVLMCFPLWIEQGSAKTISGFSLLLCILAALPFIGRIREYMKSPSVFIVWLAVCVFLTLIRNIIDQTLLISCVALVSNTVGAFVFKIADRVGEKEESGKGSESKSR